MKKNESNKAKIVKTSDKKLVKFLISNEDFARVSFVAAQKGIRFGNYMRSIVVEQAKKDFEEKIEKQS